VLPPLGIVFLQKMVPEPVPAKHNSTME